MMAGITVSALGALNSIQFFPFLITGNTLLNSLANPFLKPFSSMVGISKVLYDWEEE